MGLKMDRVNIPSNIVFSTLHLKSWPKGDNVFRFAPCKTRRNIENDMCMIKLFRGGGGVVDGEGVALKNA